jgi:hypothetical protein
VLGGGKECMDPFGFAQDDNLGRSKAAELVRLPSGESHILKSARCGAASAEVVHFQKGCGELGDCSLSG